MYGMVLLLLLRLPSAAVPVLTGHPCCVAAAVAAAAAAAAGAAAAAAAGYLPSADAFCLMCLFSPPRSFPSRSGVFSTLVDYDVTSVSCPSPQMPFMSTSLQVRHACYVKYAAVLSMVCNIQRCGSWTISYELLFFFLYHSNSIKATGATLTRD